VSQPFGAAAHPAAPPASGPPAFLETAVSLGARICRDALWAAPHCNWLGPSMEPIGGGWRAAHRAYGAELYGGTSGIGLFLAHLHAVTGERVFRRTALGALRHALARAEDIDPWSRIGAYNGWSGIGFAALAAARLLHEESLRDPALVLLEAVAATAPDAQHFDVLAGSAGAASLLLLAHGELGGPRSLGDAAVRLGDHLIASAVRSDYGWSWGGRAAGLGSGRFPWTGNLTGFSHGAAGVGWSLLELYRATGEARFRAAGEAAFGYERRWFDAGRRNWPDLREPEASGSAAAPDGPAFMTAWCHGAPGIGLARLRAFEILGDETCRAEAETAIATTLANLEGGSEMSQTNYSLCHGIFGNCELLLVGGEVLGNAAWLERARQLAGAAISTYEEQKLPWLCGTHGAAEVPGLMLGLAGIGHFYLRLANPAATPSLLILCSAG
jgi:lantibiotic modifying enzyme